ncbi:TPA: ead/Ea22-like family protein [Klebsiella quasipneumoniae subsp. quasipneumoniae]|nr:ead/Ea22-like family protein [Klebsiella quasipneumoniae subsp. quasipneumoniae]
MTDITELAQSLKAAAENAIGAHERLAAYPYGEIIDISQHEGEQIDIDITDLNEFNKEANPVNVLALVEVLEKAQQRIAELDIKNCELDSLTQRWAVERAENADRIAELESRTVTVKLPEPPGPMSVGARTVYFGIVADVVSAFQYGLTAAGIKVEVE